MFFVIKASKNKTRNAWQSLVYSLLGATVSPLASSSETTMLPPGERRYSNPIADQRLLYTVYLRELRSPPNLYQL